VIDGDQEAVLVSELVDNPVPLLDSLTDGDIAALPDMLGVRDGEILALQVPVDA
jgi:hypothetical protein